MNKKLRPNLSNIANDIINTGRKHKILHLYTEDEIYDGKRVKVFNKTLLNFGSCSYLGLDMDKRLKKGAIDAINKYGVQFSISRSYLSNTLYRTWEELLVRIFNAPLVLSTSVSLGHHAGIPIIVESNDLIIMDQYVHSSVQDAALKMQSKGVDVTVIRHNRLDELELKINALSSRYHRIWYFNDGIYSMYGDFAPVKELVLLLNKYRQLHLYTDDAHGMSVMGHCGNGYTLSQTTLHPKMVMATSLNKAFGAGGGAFIFPNAEWSQKVRNCGGAMIFSGPHQNPVIGAGIASARIHLTDQIYELQHALKEKMKYCHTLLMEKNLPVISNPHTPINFVALGLTRVGFNMVKRMMHSGFYVNLGIFPAVSEACTGIRFTITNHHTVKDIERLTTALASHLPRALHEEKRSMEDIQRAFKNFSFEKNTRGTLIKKHGMFQKYGIQKETSIERVPKEEWNSLLGKGAYDWDFLFLLEKTFRNNPQPENNWSFYYYVIRDKKGIPVLATFFTLAVIKDDIFSPATVSMQIEQERIKQPYFLSSPSLVMGALITEGKHLYIDRKRQDWKEVMMLLLDSIWKDQVRLKAENLILRDFQTSDRQMNAFFTEQGFIKVDMPLQSVMENLEWHDLEDYLARFKAKGRKYIKENFIKYETLFDASIQQHPSPQDIKAYYALYKNVKDKGFQINTFDLPEPLFTAMAYHPKFEIMELRLKHHPDDASTLVGVTFSYLSDASNYTGLIIGLDYRYLQSHNVYKQLLYQTVLRAKNRGAKKIFLGFTGEDVKRKLGATAIPQACFIQSQDTYSRTYLNSIPEFKRMETLNEYKPKKRA